MRRGHVSRTRRHRLIYRDRGTNKKWQSVSRNRINRRKGR